MLPLLSRRERLATADVDGLKAHGIHSKHMSANDRENSDFMSSDNQFYHATITKRVDFAPLLWSIRANPAGEFKFRPGQYATLRVEGTNKRSQRAYSIVSSPHENEVEFFFELVPRGELTPQVYKLQVGDEILMRKVPKGRFLLDQAGSAKITC